MSQDSQELQTAISLCKEGEIFAKKKSYSMALKYFDEAEPLLVNLNNFSWLAFLFHQKFICYLNSDNLADAEVVAKSAIKSYKDNKDLARLVVFLISYPALFQKKNNLHKALYYTKLAEDIAEKNALHNYTGFIYQKLAQLYNQFGFVIKSIRYYSKALQKFTAKNNARALCLLEVGVAYKKIFQMQKAMTTLQTSCEIFFSVKNNNYVIKALDEMRKIHLKLGNIDKASEIENKIVKLGQSAI